MSPSRITAQADSALPSSRKTGTVESSSPSHSALNTFGNMNTSMIESKFLSHPEELGVVAVGFSGGQVCGISPPPPLPPVVPPTKIFLQRPTPNRMPFDPYVS